MSIVNQIDTISDWNGLTIAKTCSTCSYENRNLNAVTNKVNIVAGKAGSQMCCKLAKHQLPTAASSAEAGRISPRALEIAKSKMCQKQIHILLDQSIQLIKQLLADIQLVGKSSHTTNISIFLCENYFDFYDENYGAVLSQVFAGIELEKKQYTQEDYNEADDSANEEMFSETGWLEKLHNEVTQFLDVDSAFDLQTVETKFHQLKKELVSNIEALDKSYSKTEIGVLLYKWITKAGARGLDPDYPKEVYEEILNEILVEGNCGLEELVVEMGRAAEAQKHAIEQKKIQVSSTPSLVKSGKRVNLDSKILVRRTSQNGVKIDTHEDAVKIYSEYKPGADRVRMQPAKFVQKFIKKINKAKKAKDDFPSLSDMRTYLIFLLKIEANEYMKSHGFDCNPQLVESFDQSIRAVLESHLNIIIEEADAYIQEELKRNQINDSVLTCPGWIEPLEYLLYMNIAKHIPKGSVELCTYNQRISDYITNLEIQVLRQNSCPRLERVKKEASLEIHRWLNSHGINGAMLKDEYYRPQIMHAFIKEFKRLRNKDALAFCVYLYEFKALVM